MTDTRVPSRAAVATLLGLLLAFNVFALLRAMPVNSYLRHNADHVHGNYDRRVTRIYNLARRTAERPFFEERDHALFHRRNPGLFMLVAELAIRAGAETPLPLQLLSVALFNVGLVLMFMFLRETFARDGPALFGVGFMLTTPFLLYHSSSIHHEPYAFVAVQATLYAFARHLRADETERRHLVVACLAFGIACLNYWMYYASTYLLLLALCWRAGRLRLRLAAVLALPPIFGLCATVAQAVFAYGWERGLFAIADIAVARTGDWRLEGSKWFPDRVFIDNRVLARYPGTVVKRVADMIGYPLWALALTLALAVVSLRLRSARWGWVLLAGFAALSWNLLMVQHTVIHEFSGMYGHAGWMLVVCAAFAEVQRRLQPVRAGRPLVAAICAGLLWFGLSDHYVPRTRQYWQNLVTHGVGQVPARPWEW